MTSGAGSHALSIAMTALLLALGATDDEITTVFHRHGGEIPPFNTGALLAYARRALNDARTNPPAVTTSHGQ